MRKKAKEEDTPATGEAPPPKSRLAAYLPADGPEEVVGMAGVSGAPDTEHDGTGKYGEAGHGVGRGELVSHTDLSHPDPSTLILTLTP